MEQLTLQQVIDGYRRISPDIEVCATGLAAFLSSRSPKVAIAVERIEGTMAHFVQSTMIEDPMFFVSGGWGDLYRWETSRFEIDMAPQNAG